MESLQYLMASGSNACGQLATGSLEDSHTFSPCIFSGHSAGSLPPNTNRVIQIAAGSNHTLVLIETIEQNSGCTSRELWGCGDGRRGQLGPNSQRPGVSKSTLNPVDLHLEEYGFEGFDLRSIATGWETSFIVLSRAGSNDVLISMGADDFGDLGIGKHKAKNSRIKQKPFHIVDLHSSNTINGDQMSITSLTTGPHHIVLQLQAIAKDGSTKQFVVGWGTSRHGQLGAKFRTTPFITTPEIISTQKSLGSISSIALGNQHTILLHHSGRLSGLGTDKKNQISGVTALTHVRGIDCTWNGTYAIVEAEEEVQLLSNGSNSKGQLGRPNNEAQVPGFSAVQLPLHNRQLKHIACGSEHVLALLTNKGTGDREVWGWGWNEHGNLGIGTTEDIEEPRRLWPPQSQVDGSTLNVEKYGIPIDIWAGCGSSWIAVAHSSITDRA